MRARPLTTFDILRICGYVASACAILTPDVIHAFGFSSAQTEEIATVSGRLLLAATLISSVIKNPSPPSGTANALIPFGSVPVVAAESLGTNGPHVAVADPTTVLAVTPATTKPPAQIALDTKGP